MTKLSSPMHFLYSWKYFDFNKFYLKEWKLGLDSKTKTPTDVSNTVSEKIPGSIFVSEYITGCSKMAH